MKSIAAGTQAVIDGSQPTEIHHSRFDVRRSEVTSGKRSLPRH